MVRSQWGRSEVIVIYPDNLIYVTYIYSWIRPSISIMLHPSVRQRSIGSGQSGWLQGELPPSGGSNYKMGILLVRVQMLAGTDTADTDTNKDHIMIYVHEYIYIYLFIFKFEYI